MKLLKNNQKNIKQRSRKLIIILFIIFAIAIYLFSNINLYKKKSKLYLSHDLSQIVMSTLYDLVAENGELPKNSSLFKNQMFKIHEDEYLNELIHDLDLSVQIDSSNGYFYLKDKKLGLTSVDVQEYTLFEELIKSDVILFSSPIYNDNFYLNFSGRILFYKDDTIHIEKGSFYSLKFNEIYQEFTKDYDIVQLLEERGKVVLLIDNNEGTFKILYTPNKNIDHLRPFFENVNKLITKNDSISKAILAFKLPVNPPFKYLL